MPPKIIRLPSALYPFTLKDLQKLQYRQYTLTNVYGKISQQQRQACVDLWVRNQVLSQDLAWQRSAEVCYFITQTSTQNLIGVNTLYVDRVVADGPLFYLNRMFIDPRFRDTRLMITGTAVMLCFAKTNLEHESIPGVININENKKLSRPGMERIFSQLGYRSYGIQNGQVILLFEFDKIKIN